MPISVLPPPTSQQPSTSRVAVAPDEALRRELAKALGVAQRPSARELAEAFKSGAGVVTDLKRKGQIEPQAAETLLSSMAMLFIQAMLLNVMETMFEPGGGIGSIRHWLREAAR